MSHHSKSTHVFPIRMWSAEYFKKKTGAYRKGTGLYHGLVTETGVGGKNYHFKSAAEMLKILETLYTRKEKRGVKIHYTKKETEKRNENNKDNL